ncbi:MAG: hypothetical protein ACXWN0_03715, partial [Isosphaeraceae bacterium]
TVVDRLPGSVCPGRRPRDRRRGPVPGLAPETVPSFNIYDRRVDPGKWGFFQSLGRPVIIVEFHVGALDRGMFHPGLVAAIDQHERAAIYTDYVKSVLKNPALVGCH